MGGKLILNTSRLNDRNKKIDLEVLFSLIPHLTKHYPEILPNYFFNSLLGIFRSFIDYTKLSTETQWKLVTAVCKICPKYTKSIIARLDPHRVTNWYYVTAELKKNVTWTINTKLWMQLTAVVSIHQSHKKSTLG